ncbi:MAG: hypothetical protein ACLTDI_13175 [Acutalibacteraceae bacterium]
MAISFTPSSLASMISSLSGRHLLLRPAVNYSYFMRFPDAPRSWPTSMAVLPPPITTSLLGTDISFLRPMRFKNHSPLSTPLRSSPGTSSSLDTWVPEAMYTASDCFFISSKVMSDPILVFR